ncbi:PcfJ domain-containing protein [uncultured Alistipes sp.]|uniref:PcfJ domain-containing protein n=1 Tax=uncultured Alistipes sp. TaxID=538949 RepID=UPI00272A218B|nr:PcfJ domain-containing protein [uncultured Alistipes sp.]
MLPSKRALRAFMSSCPAPAIQPGHGLLTASGIDYIIRSGVHIIDHSRVLVLYVYGRGDVLQGVREPVYATFMARDDHVTLARVPDGPSRWRRSSLDLLSGWGWERRCAFASVPDERRVQGYLQAPGPGLEALVRAQRSIRDKRSLARQQARDNAVRARMSPFKALPRGLPGWIRKSVMPAYFRCPHASSRRPVTGVCTSCGHEVTLPAASHGKSAVCPRCGRDLIIKSAAMGRYEDRATVQALERVDANTIAVRIVKAVYSYGRGDLTPAVSLRENSRILVHVSPTGEAIAEPYYLSYGNQDGRPTPWRAGYRPVFFKYQYQFDADVCGRVYPGNLSSALAGTPWEYCPLAPFMDRFPGEPMELAPFLIAHVAHPHLEKLVKTGFCSLASDLAYGRVPDGLLDGSQNRTHRILGIRAEDVDFLLELNPDVNTLRIFQGYAGLKDRRELLLWQRRNGVTRDIPEMLSHGAAPRGLMRYVDGQLASHAGLERPYGGARYPDAQTVLSEWRDYADMGRKLGGLILYPRDLAEAHDIAQARLKAEEDAAMRRDFVAAMAGLYDRLRYQRDGLAVVVPSGPDEIVAEGRALRTCVGGYVGRVADGSCVILFVRAADAPDTPLYTMEVRDRRVVQLRGQGNSDAPEDVRAFVGEYERRVLSRLAA